MFTDSCSYSIKSMRWKYFSSFSLPLRPDQIRLLPSFTGLSYVFLLSQRIQPVDKFGVLKPSLKEHVVNSTS